MSRRRPDSKSKQVITLYELLMKAWPLLYTAISGLVYAVLIRVSLPGVSAEYAFWLLLAIGLVTQVKGVGPKALRAVLEAILSNLPKP